MNVTILLGAGASKAFTMCPYPLLKEILDKMLLFAQNLPDEIENKEMLERHLPRQKLFLTYAITRALNGPYEDLEAENIGSHEIDSQFEDMVEIINENNFGLDRIFEMLAEYEVGDYKSITKAHWALTHAISFYMLQMFSLKQSRSNFDRAHINLNSLIEELLLLNSNVNVIDFNYDCILERIRVDYGGSSEATFDWNVGRPRKVLADELGIETVSELVRAGRFRAPRDGEDFPKRANLIKPHGDMCAFLWGNSGVYYRGGRHSQSTSALFPPKLADIGETDDFLRASIMPPTNSRRRHSSVFYDEELLRFKMAVRNSSMFVIIGWSAKGSDGFYNSIFDEVFENKVRETKVFIIDKSDTRDRARELFGSRCQIKSFQIDGFTGESALKLREDLRREIPVS